VRCRLMILVREEQRSAGIWVLYVKGRLLVPGTGDLRHRVHALLRRGARRIQVNLAGVRDIDAGGVGELVRAYNIAQRSQADLQIASASVCVRELLDRAGLLEFLSADSTQSRLEAV
jgi:anti-anti-sigma factor